MSVETTQPYGYFGNPADIESAVEQRLQGDEDPRGEGELHLGANFIRTDTSLQIEDATRTYPRIPFRVGWDGKIHYQYFHEAGQGDNVPHLFGHEWSEVENP